MNIDENAYIYLNDTELADILGGKINWGGVVGNCLGGAVIGAFGGIAGSVSGCVVGAGSALIDGL